MPNVSGSTRKTIIVFGAHPDDIEIGMAGTICRLAAAGNDVYSCIATIPEDRPRRTKEAREAARILGIKDVIFLSLKAEDIGYNRATIGAIDAIVRELNPHSVFTHWIEDSHQDHVNTTRCVISSTRKNNFNVYMYEQTIPGGITPAAFRAQYLIDVSEFIDEKMASICAHKSQLQRNGDWWMEGIRGRAMYRGYQIRTKYAEAFEIIKINGDTNLFGSETNPGQLRIKNKGVDELLHQSAKREWTEVATELPEKSSGELSAREFQTGESKKELTAESPEETAELTA